MPLSYYNDTSMNLYVFRHAATYHTKTTIPYGNEIETADILSEGIPAIEKLANFLKRIKTDANYTSPYKRCLQTAEIVTEISGKAFQLNDSLGEYREDKESFEDFSQRVKNFLNHLEKEKITSSAICTHGGVMAGIFEHISKGEFKIEYLNNFPLPGILII